MNLSDLLTVLARRARTRGQESRFTELLTHHPETACQVAEFLEARKRVEEVFSGLTAEAVEALTLCGVTFTGGRGGQTVAGLIDTVEG
jgi:hypothetical protein